MRVRFFDPSRVYAAQQAELSAAVHEVLASRQVVLGPQVEAFERELAAAVGVAFAVGVASGTDALELALRALDISADAEVLCPDLTSPATATAILRAGLRPLLVDVDEETLTIDPSAAASAVDQRTAAIVAVHLYGRAAALQALSELGLPLVEDAAQAHGLKLDRGSAGGVGMVGCFSFYPTKNLGAFGDAGAVTTPDAELAARVRRLRQYGQRERDYAEELGANSRLDELQAAILRVRFPRLAQENLRRAEIAASYDDALGRASPRGVHHLYVLRSPEREQARLFLQKSGIDTGVHYPSPISAQPAFSDARVAGSVEVASKAAKEVFSVPCHAHLSRAEEEHVASVLVRMAAALPVR